MDKNVASVNNAFFLSMFYIFSSMVPRCFHTCFIKSVGQVFPYAMKVTAELIRQNLKVVSGGACLDSEIRKLVKATFRNYGRYLLDFMSMHRMGEHNKHVYLEKTQIGEEHFNRAISMGKGVLLITPHLGNWELGGIDLALKGYKLNVLAIKDNNRMAGKFRECIRKECGISTIYVDGDSMHTIINVINALKKNEVVALLGDRDGSSRTIEINFFGRITNFPVGVAYFAMASGAPVLPVFVVLGKNGKYQGVIEKPVLFEKYKVFGRKEAIKLGIQEIARVFELYIRQYPDQWYNFYPFWGTKRNKISDKT